MGFEIFLVKVGTLRFEDEVMFVFFMYGNGRCDFVFLFVGFGIFFLNGCCVCFLLFGGRIKMGLIFGGVCYFLEFFRSKLSWKINFRKRMLGMIVFGE